MQCEVAKRGRQKMNILREKGYENDLYLKIGRQVQRKYDYNYKMQGQSLNFER